MGNQKEGKSLKFIKTLNIMLCASMSVWVVSQEEKRFLELFKKIANIHKADTTYEVLSWSITEGLLNLTPSMISQNGVFLIPEKVNQLKTDESQKKATDLEKQYGINATNAQLATHVASFQELHTYILRNTLKKVFIIKDLHNLLDPSKADYPQTVRRIKDLIFYTKTNKSSLIFLAPTFKNCIDFEKDIQVLEMPRPDEIDINELLDSALSILSELNELKLDIPYTNSEGKKIKSKHPNAELLREKIIQNLRGLTETEISQILRYFCVKNRGLEESVISEIKDSKKQIIEKSGALEYIEVPDDIDVGGHTEFKEYIQEQGLYLNKKIRQLYNLKAPKGVLLVGISGGGKSVMTKYIGYKWNIPVIRLNFDSIFGKYLGESETNLNNALSIADANSPCILFVDELEKALGGSGTGDGGTGLRILGRVLTWMQEREEMVFMVATANNVARLPPELSRAGRFNETFFFDLPGITDCEEIIKIKIKENGFILEDKEVFQLANRCFEKEMTGAEIESAIIKAVYIAAIEASKIDEKVNVSASFVRKAIDDTNSFAILHKEELDRDRKNALNNYRFTSKEVRDRLEKRLGLTVS